MTEIVAIKYAEPEPSGLAEIENIREFFKLNKVEFFLMDPNLVYSHF